MPTVQERPKNPRAPTLLQVRKDPVKLTALLYLRDAIRNQRYEECPLFIQIAKEFGAQEQEVVELLEDPRRTPK